SSDVCSSDLHKRLGLLVLTYVAVDGHERDIPALGDSALDGRPDGAGTREREMFAVQASHGLRRHMSMRHDETQQPLLGFRHGQRIFTRHDASFKHPCHSSRPPFRRPSGGTTPPVWPSSCPPSCPSSCPQGCVFWLSDRPLCGCRRCASCALWRRCTKCE